MFKYLNIDIWKQIYSLLDPHDQSSLGQTEKKHHSFYKTNYIDNNPFFWHIQKQLVEIGYPLLKKEIALNGIRGDHEQTDLLNRLKEHKKIRTILNLVQVKNKKTLPTETLKEIQRYIIYFKIIFGLSGDDHGIHVDEELLIKSNLNAKINNPIYLRIYLESFIYLLLFDNSLATFENCKKVIILSLMLIRAGDPTGFFCILRLLSYGKDQGEKKLYYEFLKKVCQRIEGFRDLTSSETPLLTLLHKAIPRYFSKQDFLEEELMFSFATFDLYCFFYFPSTGLRLIDNLMRDFGNKSLHILAKTPDLVVVLLNQRKFTSIYRKIYTHQVEQHLELLKNNILTVGEEYSLFQLQQITQNQHYHYLLPFEDFFKIKESVLKLLIKDKDIFEAAYWSLDNINKLEPYLVKLMKLPEIVKKWPLEEIIALTKLPEKFTDILAECTHKEYIFENINSVNDLIEMVNYKINDISPLEVLCGNDNFLFCMAIFERFTNVRNLLKVLPDNPCLQRYFSTMNIGLILMTFPQFLIPLRNNQFVENSNFNKLVTCSQNREAFQLGLQMCENQLSLICENDKLFNLFDNGALRQFIEKQNISLRIINIHYELFQLLHDKLLPQHRLLQLLPFDFILDMSEANLLMPLLNIKSETLFNWVVFNRQDMPFVSNQSSNLFIRPLSELLFLLQDSTIVNCLDRFGFVNKDQHRINFVHCDSYWYKYFDAKSLHSLETIPVTESESLLAKVCRIDPGIFLLVMNNNQEKIGTEVNKLISFYSQDFLEILSSSPHGKLFYLYFDLGHIKELFNDVLTHNVNSLDFLVNPENKKLFYNLIKACPSQEVISNNVQILNLQRIPTHYKVDQTKFFELFNRLKPFLRKNSISLVNILLKSFTADDIIVLSMKVHPTSTLFYFDILGNFSHDLLEKFLTKFTEQMNKSAHNNLMHLFIKSIDTIYASSQKKWWNSKQNTKKRKKTESVSNMNHQDKDENPAKKPNFK